MSKEREALKLALEALEVATTPLAKDRQEVLRASAAIKEALAQPAQEPVGYIDHADGLPVWSKKPAKGSLLYTAPQQHLWVGLTKTVVGNHLRRHAFGDQPTFRQGFKQGVAFAESKLKEKNT